jgi:two-component system response regulator
MDGGTKPIILVEDSDDDAELTIQAFSEAGVRTPIVRLADGRAALRYLSDRARDELPVAVLLDLNLPGTSGLRILQAIQAHPNLRPIPVIVMTSSQNDEDRLGAYDQGAVSFVRKPVDFAAFVKAVKTLGLHWSASLSVFGSAES